MKKNIATNQIFEQIKTLLIGARNRVVQTVNTTMVYTYFEIGKIIVEYEQEGTGRAEYNKKILERLSNQLIKEFGKGFSVTNLQQMRFFYNTYQKQQTLSVKLQKANILSSQSPDSHLKSSTLSRKSQKQQTLSAKSPKFTLSWSHYVFLMRLDEKERNFYERESIENNWSLRELKRQYDSALFERIVLSKDKKGVLKNNLKNYHTPQETKDIVKDPYILEFLGLEEKIHYSESDLEQAIIDKLEHFLLELGKGFTFVSRQQRISFDEEHFFIDLVFYNRLLKCFVLIDLKIGKLKHQDLGQIQMYVNYYDRFVKTGDENPTIGIVLCKDKNDTLVEITLPKKNNQIFASKYKLYLPSKEEFKKQLQEAIDLKFKKE